MINYEEIIGNLTVENIEEILNKLEVPFKDTEKALIMPTVCHNDDVETASWKLYYYKDTHLFHCYTDCGDTFSIFKFLKRYYETRQIEYDWYNDIFKLITGFSAPAPSAQTYKSIRDNYKPQKSRKELPTYPNGIIDCFIKFYPVEWLMDNITPTAMDKYNIRFSVTQNKIIIPHYNINGELVGIRGRALDPFEVENFGKYMPVQIEGKWYSHPLSLNLYGLNYNKDNIKKDGICYIFESEKSVMQCENFEMRNYAVASCGSNVNKYQIDILMRYCAPRYVVVCFDKEEKEGEDKYFNKLWNMCKKYTDYCNMSFIYDRNNLLKLKDSPSDRGEKTFIKLLEERIIVK